MYILWKNHPYDQTKNGTKEHVPRSVAEGAITFKQAEIAPRPNYGTPEWQAERRANAAKVPDPGDTSISMGTAWGLYQQLGKVAVVKTVNGESFFYESVPSDCPATVRQQFLNSTAGDPVAAAEALDAARRAQLEQEQKEKKSSYGVLFRRT